MATFSLGQSVGVSIQTGEVDDLAITAAKLAADAVETAKVKDLAITLAKMAADSVDGSKIADASIDIEHVQQTGRAALYALRSNAADDGLEFGDIAVDKDSPITINGLTLNLDKWLM